MCRSRALSRVEIFVCIAVASTAGRRRSIIKSSLQNEPSPRRKDIIDAGGVDVCRSRREIQRARVQTHQHMEGRTSTLDTWVIALHIGGACTEAGHVR